MRVPPPSGFCTRLGGLKETNRVLCAWFLVGVKGGKDTNGFVRDHVFYGFEGSFESRDNICFRLQKGGPRPVAAWFRAQAK